MIDSIFFGALIGIWIASFAIVVERIVFSFGRRGEDYSAKKLGRLVLLLGFLVLVAVYGSTEGVKIVRAAMPTHSNSE